MTLSIQTYFDELAVGMMAGNFGSSPIQLTFPLAIYFGDQSVVIEQQDAFDAMMGTIFAAHDAAGITRQTATVRAESIRFGSMRSYWVEWRHFDLNDALINITFARYFCEAATNGTLSLRLIEILDTEDDAGVKALPWITPHIVH